mgnify:CR=1 FL=1
MLDKEAGIENTIKGEQIAEFGGNLVYYELLNTGRKLRKAPPRIRASAQHLPLDKESGSAKVTTLLTRKFSLGRHN